MQRVDLENHTWANYFLASYKVSESCVIASRLCAAVVKLQYEAVFIKLSSLPSLSSCVCEALIETSEKSRPDLQYVSLLYDSRVCLSSLRGKARHQRLWGFKSCYMVKFQQVQSQYFQQTLSAASVPCSAATLQCILKTKLA